MPDRNIGVLHRLAEVDVLNLDGQGHRDSVLAVSDVVADEFISDDCYKLIRKQDIDLTVAVSLQYGFSLTSG